ncbi:hypothetical protein INT47_009585 [Mucor saturninus]|uniref:Retrotransposon gag domain-containing protein n=1 Tax=Mucor saturninus TaxID=64648 RepID=A0A8H7QJR1_9FUNG|nr:hypothetical protein INT47_009585 [Mucor saturninus]
MSQNDRSSSLSIGSPIDVHGHPLSPVGGSLSSVGSPIDAPADVPTDVHDQSSNTEPFETQDDSMEGIEQTFVESTALNEPIQEVNAVNTQPTGEPKPTGSDNKIDDIKTAISIIRDEILDLTRYVGVAPENDPSLNNKRTRLNRRTQDLKLMKNCLEAMKDTVKDTIQVSKRSSVVPVKLPMFCWEGHDNIPGEHIFEDIKTCLTRFTDVMNCHNLDLDANFLRLLPPQLTSNTRVWFEGYLTKFRTVFQVDPTWARFSAAFQARYGLNAQEERNNCARELNNISMLRGESLESFIDRFNSLRRRAVDQILPKSVLAEKFLFALPDNLMNQVSIATATLPIYKQNDVDVLAGLARGLLNRLSKGKMRADSMDIPAPRTPKRSAFLMNQNDDVHQFSRLSKHAATSRNNHTRGSSSGRNTSPVSVASSSGSSSTTGIQPRESSGKFCSFHCVTTHNTVDCHAAAGGVPRNNRRCRKCQAENWTPQHVCNTSRGGPNVDGNIRLNAISFSRTSGSPQNTNNTRINHTSPETANMSIALWNDFASNASNDMPSDNGDNLDDDEMTDANMVARQAQQYVCHRRYSTMADYLFDSNKSVRKTYNC